MTEINIELTQYLQRLRQGPSSALHQNSGSGTGQGGEGNSRGVRPRRTEAFIHRGYDGPQPGRNDGQPRNAGHRPVDAQPNYPVHHQRGDNPFSELDVSGYQRGLNPFAQSDDGSDYTGGSSR
jgi:hypothetical protein